MTTKKQPILYAGKYYQPGQSIDGTMLTLVRRDPSKSGAGGGQVWVTRCLCGRETKKRVSTLVSKRPVMTCGKIQCPYYSAQKSKIARVSNQERTGKAVAQKTAIHYQVRVSGAGKGKQYRILFEGEWKTFKDVAAQLKMKPTALYLQIRKLEVGEHRIPLVTKRLYEGDVARLSRTYAKSRTIVYYYQRKGYTFEQIETLFKDEGKTPFERLVDRNVDYLTSIGIIRPSKPGQPQACPCCDWRSL